MQSWITKKGLLVALTTLAIAMAGHVIWRTATRLEPEAATADRTALNAVLQELQITPIRQSIFVDPFALPDLSGQQVAVADFAGRLIVVNIWATWCEPCREEMPQLQALHAELARHGLSVVAINQGESPAVVNAYIQRNQYSFAVLLDRDHSVGAQFAVRGLPTTYLIAPNGQIIGRAIGQRTWEGPHMVATWRRLITLAAALAETPE